MLSHLKITRWTLRWLLVVKGQSIANCYIANYSIEKLQAIAKFSVKLSQYVHCKILAQTREQSYIVNYSIKCRKRLQYLRSNYCNPCIAHYFANYRKLLPNLLPNYRIAHRTLFCQLSQTFAISSAKLSQSVHCTLFCQLSQTVAKPSVKLSHSSSHAADHCPDWLCHRDGLRLKP